MKWLRRVLSSNVGRGAATPSKGGSSTSRVRSGLLEKCGGCGTSEASELALVRDKNDNRGFLCASCRSEYEHLLQPDSIRRLWMCSQCHFRILAGTRIDDVVDPEGRCPNCSANVNLSLVNLSNDRPVKSGVMGEPLA